MGTPVDRDCESLDAVTVKFFQLDVEGQNQLLLFLAQSRPPDEKLDALWCTSSARMGHFGFQVKRQSEPMLIGLV